MKFICLCAVLLHGLLFTIALTAQDADSTICDKHKSCGCATSLAPASTMISHAHSKGQWMVSYRWMWMRMKGNLQNGKEISDQNLHNAYSMAPKSMNMQMHMMMGMVGITNKLTLMAMLQIQNNAMSMSVPMSVPSPTPTTEPEPEHHHDHDHQHRHSNPSTPAGDQQASENQLSDYHQVTMNNFGLGDSKLYALYSVYRSEWHQWLATLGASIPTGSIKATGKGDAHNHSRLPYSMQLGSGSVEALPSLSYLYANRRIETSTQLSYVWRLNTNSVGYRLGNELSVNSWIAYRILPWLSMSTKAEWTTLAPIKGKDMKLIEASEPAANKANYGGQWLTGLAGVNFYVLKQKLSLEGGIPLYQQGRGVQINREFTLHAAWQILL